VPLTENEYNKNDYGYNIVNTSNPRMSTTRGIAVITYNLANAKTQNKHNKTDCDHNLETFTHKVSKPYLPSK
jgi:hypothetical protein